MKVCLIFPWRRRIFDSNHLIFHAAGPDQSAFLEQYGRHVLPRLREN